MDTNQPSSAATIEAGQKALAQGAWREARSAFELAIGASDAAKHFSRALLEPGENAEIFSGLAEAMWWLGEIRESLECWERAYSEFRRQPDAAQAASVAIQLAVIYDANLGNQAAAAGWVARATRLVDEHALEPLRGWVLIASATDSDPGQHEALARQVYRLGRTSGDRHLELCALTQIGVALIDQGRITEGMTFHDEAMAGALAGEGELDTVVFTACEMMDSYSRCAQYERMAQWIRAADRFVERYGCPYLNASCRTHYGEVLFATGDWARRGGVASSDTPLRELPARRPGQGAGEPGGATVVAGTRGRGRAPPGRVRGPRRIRSGLHTDLPPAGQVRPGCRDGPALARSDRRGQAAVHTSAGAAR